MKTITFECEIITPMFMAGADGRTPELRTASIKGALRFWWRALNGHLVNQKDRKWDYSRLKEEENKIFGGIGDKSLRSKVILRIKNSNFKSYDFDELDRKCHDEVKCGRVKAIKYITFGLYDFRDPSKNRKFLMGNFSLECTFDEKIEEDLKTAFSMLHHFGGLGSKARNGFGSIDIKSKNFNLYTIDQLNHRIRLNRLVPYTAFENSEIKIFECKSTFSNYYQALEDLAQKYYNAKKSTKNDEFIATNKIKRLNFERYPKRYFFSVKKVDKGYQWRCIYLPMLVSDKNYDSANNNFQKNL